jgi:hypothetical protein
MTDAEVKAKRRKQFDTLIRWMYDQGARKLCDVSQGTTRLTSYEFASSVVIVEEYDHHTSHGWRFYLPIEEPSWDGIQAALQEFLDR